MHGLLLENDFCSKINDNNFSSTPRVPSYGYVFANFVVGKPCQDFKELANKKVTCKSTLLMNYIYGIHKKF